MIMEALQATNINGVFPIIFFQSSQHLQDYPIILIHAMESMFHLELLRRSRYSTLVTV